jgi:4-amino-4-deoxy-L-arabinose transferase-like glycosyltransferase
VLFWLWVRPAWRLRELAEPRALAVLLLLSLFWPVAISVQDFDYGWFFVVNEHILRFFALREPNDYYTGPLYYYLPRILLFALPWSFFLPLLAVRRRITELEKFAWIWFGVCLVFFSLSLAKANYYMTPGMPALALLVALALAEAIERERRGALVALSAFAALLAALALWVLEERFWMRTPRRIWITVLRLQPELAITLVAVGAIIAVAALLFALRRNRAALYACALAGVPALAFVMVLAHHADAFISGRSLGEYLRRDPGARIYLFQDYENLSSVPFYLGRQVGIVESESNDLAFGLREQPNHPNALSASQFRAAAASDDVVLLVHRRRLGAYRAKLGGLGLTSRNRVGNVAVFSNYH